MTVETRGDFFLLRQRGLKFMSSPAGKKLFKKALEDLGAMYASASDPLAEISYYESLNNLCIAALRAMCLPWVEEFMMFREIEYIEKKLMQEQPEVQSK